MEFELKGKVLKFEKNLSDLDKIVIDFVGLLNECKIKYVIISGYVAILFGRPRGTEDVDMFIEHMGQKESDKFFDKLNERGYSIINAGGKEEGLELLGEKIAIRVARKGEAVPNFEIKYPKKELDYTSLNHPLEVHVTGNKLLISQFEIEIPFKLWLGSDKDIEDAVHIYELFKGKLDKKLMHEIATKLGVGKEMEKYGIE